MVKLVGSSLIESLFSVSLIAFALSLFLFVFTEISLKSGIDEYTVAQQLIDNKISQIERSNLQDIQKIPHHYELKISEMEYESCIYFEIVVLYRGKVLCKSNFIPIDESET